MKQFIHTVFFFCGLSAWAQHMPINTQYMYQGLLVNPAITGAREDLYVSFTHRKQWLGNNLTPVSSFFSAHTPTKQEKIAIGGQVHRQTFNGLTKYGVSGLAAYRIRFDHHKKLSFGLKLGVKQNTFDFTDLFVNDPQDPTFTSASNEISPDIGFGTYYRTDHYYLGLAVPQMNNVLVNERLKTRNWNKTLLAGVKFRLTDKLDLLPNLLIRKIGRLKSQTDLTTILRVKKALDLGIILRSGGKIIGTSIDYCVNNKLQLGYSFDTGLRANRLENTLGNHELSISYEFKEISKTPNTKFF